MNTIHKLFYTLICVFALLFSGCPMEAPPKGGARLGLDDRLVGAWRFTFTGNYEECVIGTTPKDDPTALGYLVFGYKGWMGGSADAYHIGFGGDIVYAASFRASLNDDKSAGVIIIKYWPGYENTWRYWSEQPPGWAAQGYRPVGKRYYGLYYINLYADGHQVFIVQTNEQATNYGPTETRTLEEAIAKFTEGNLHNMMNIDVGDPQTRYSGQPGFPGLGGL